MKSLIHTHNLRVILNNHKKPSLISSRKMYLARYLETDCIKEIFVAVVKIYIFCKSENLQIVQIRKK